MGSISPVCHEKKCRPRAKKVPSENWAAFPPVSHSNLCSKRTQEIPPEKWAAFSMFFETKLCSPSAPLKFLQQNRQHFPLLSKQNKGVQARPKTSLGKMESIEDNFPNRLLKIHRKVTNGKNTRVLCFKHYENGLFFFLGGPGVGRSDGRKKNRLKEIFPKSIEENFSKIDQRKFSKIDCSKSIEKAQPAKKTKRQSFVLQTL